MLTSAASMLRENMESRPTIYQALKEGLAMQGKEVPIHDVCIHSDNTREPILRFTRFILENHESIKEGLAAHPKRTKPNLLLSLVPSLLRSLQRSKPSLM